MEKRLSDIRRGRLVVPEGADPGTFILSAGKLGHKPLAVAPTPARPTIEALAAYRSELPDGAKEPNSLRSERSTGSMSHRLMAIAWLDLARKN